MPSLIRIMARSRTGSEPIALIESAPKAKTIFCTFVSYSSGDLLEFFLKSPNQLFFLNISGRLFLDLC